MGNNFKDRLVGFIIGIVVGTILLYFFNVVTLSSKPVDILLLNSMSYHMNDSFETVVIAHVYQHENVN